MIHQGNNKNKLINNYNTIALVNYSVVRVDCSAIP